jgi:putative copper resistance protein D
LDPSTVSFIDTVVLWVHLFSAVLFVGGSFFMWIVVVPASHLLTENESERTRIVGRIAKQFARVVNPALLMLALTGVYNATWYLPSTSALLDSYAGDLLLAKLCSFVALLLLLYLSNVYFGRRITRLAKEGRLEELKVLRRKSRLVSFANLGLMALILLFVALMQTTT